MDEIFRVDNIERSGASEISTLLPASGAGAVFVLSFHLDIVGKFYFKGGPVTRCIQHIRDVI